MIVYTTALSIAFIWAGTVGKAKTCGKHNPLSQNCTVLYNMYHSCF